MGPAGERVQSTHLPVVPPVRTAAGGRGECRAGRTASRRPKTGRFPLRSTGRYVSRVDTPDYGQPEEDTYSHDSVATPNTFDERSDLKEIVARVRAEISDRDWLFFWRVVVDGQSSTEVAEEFGVTANAVRLVKMRVLRRMRQQSQGDPGSAQ